MPAIWIIEPRDPLIVRDGRPFEALSGVRAYSLSFPYPSTITGGIRTLAGISHDGFFDTERIDAVRRIAVRGPLLVRMEEETEDIAEWLPPAPADALLLGKEPAEKDTAARKRLVPLGDREALGGMTDLEDGLQPVGLKRPDPRKPIGDGPRYWRWTALMEWMESPPEESSVKLSELGGEGPVLEDRVHVSLQPETGTVVEGALYQTRGLSFTSGRSRLAMCVMTDAGIEPGIRPLGGERRLVIWRKGGQEIPGCPDSLKTAIAENRGCRVMLLTPACFQGGFRPSWVLEPRCGVSPALKAAAVGRPAVISGWDFAENRPKPTRRLAPAGSVYFLSLEGAPERIAEWVDTLWLQTISDDHQDRLDGFGMVVFGVWHP